MKKKVVITGMGVVSAIGTNLCDFENGLRDGKCGISDVERLDTTGYRNSKAGEVKKWLDKTDVDRCITFLDSAVSEAISNAGLNLEQCDSMRIGVAVSSSLGCVEQLECFVRENDPVFLDKVPHYIPVSYVAEKYALHGPCVCVDTACASGSNIFGYAYDLVASGRCDVVITGGVDILSTLSYSGFNSLMNISKETCHPFSHEHLGIILGEGCGIAILESAEYAESRCAEMICEICGYGLSNDAFHETKPDPSGNGAVHSMQSALHNAGIKPNEVDYLNAHGTGTAANDKMEVLAVQKVFADNIGQLKMSSIKGAIGHNLGAAGAVELIATALAIQKNFLPPTLNFTASDEDAKNIDFVPNHSVQRTSRIAMSNSFGFGGHCCSVVLRKIN